MYMSLVSARNEFEGLSDDLVIGIIRFYPSHRWSSVSKAMKELYARNETEMKAKWCRHQQHKWDPSNAINMLNARKAIDNVTSGFSSYKLEKSFIDGRKFVAATLTNDGNYLIMTIINENAILSETKREILLLQWYNAQETFKLVKSLIQHQGRAWHSATETVVVSADGRFLAIAKQATGRRCSGWSLTIFDMYDPDFSKYNSMCFNEQYVKISFGNNAGNIMFTEFDGYLTFWNFTDDEKEPTRHLLVMDDDYEFVEVHYYDEIMITGSLAGRNIVFHGTDGGLYACAEDDLALYDSNDAINELPCFVINTYG